MEYTLMSEENNLGEAIEIVSESKEVAVREPSTVNVTVEELRKINLLIGIPMYGGMCSGMTTKSLCELHTAFANVGIPVTINFLFNESLVQRARNYIADTFMQNEQFTHLLFIDADIGFSPNDVVTLLSFNMKDPECTDVVAGVYPRKTIAWEKVEKAVNSGLIRNPNYLENFAGDFVFNFKRDITEFTVKNPLEVAETGTGFMLIPRHVMEKFRDSFPEYRYTPDHVRTPGFDGSHEITAFFHCEIDKESGRYLSEDYFFCRKIAEIGLKTTVLPWIELQHVGTYVYKGSVANMAHMSLDLVSAGYDESIN